MTTHQPRVAIVHFGAPLQTSGGGLYLENLLKTLAQTPNIDFTAISIGSEEHKQSNYELASSIGFKHHHISFPMFSSQSFDRHLKHSFMDKWNFMWERELARPREQTDPAVRELLVVDKPDLIILVNLFSALLVPSLLDLSTPICLVATNDMRLEQRCRRRAGTARDSVSDRLLDFLERHWNCIANKRLHEYEKWAYSRCSAIVFLTQRDIPAELPGRIINAVLPPILPKGDRQWAFHRSGRLLFSGHVSHHPNRQAIEWTCGSFARAVALLDSRVRINIIGASAEDVPRSWHAMNVTFLGRADKTELIHQMTTADLFIAPIEYPGGAKLKLAECISYGTPFLATRAAMSGLSFLVTGPQIDLARPVEAAHLAVKYTHTPEMLLEMSQTASAQTDKARELQLSAWTTLLRSAMSTNRTKPHRTSVSMIQATDIASQLSYKRTNRWRRW